MAILSLLAYAKINLTLDVVRRRPDGYHEVDMILQSVGLADRVTLEDLPDEPGTVRLSVTGPDGEGLPDVPADSRNLAFRAAALLREERPFPAGLSIRLEKHIPAAAGLAGGSADAAAVLAGANSLFGLGLSPGGLARLGLRLGADIPFCLTGGTQRARGIGERLTKLAAPPDLAVLLAKPAEGVSTAAVYGALRIETRGPYPHVRTEEACLALERGLPEELAACCGNLLQEVTGPMLPAVGELAGIMKENGALAALMSGSGPTVFGLFRDREAAEAAACRLPDVIFRTVTGFVPQGLARDHTGGEEA